MATELTQAARDGAPAMEFGVIGDPTRLAVTCGEPMTFGTEIV